VDHRRLPRAHHGAQPHPPVLARWWRREHRHHRHLREGGANIIAIFGQWGAIQLLLAALLWVLLLRYRGLLPLIALVLLVEPLLRELSGRLKPIETMGTAPGAALNSAAIVFAALLLYLTLCPADGARREP